MNDNMIAALKRERIGYVRRGLTDRVRQVDEQLAHYGVVVETEPAPPAEVDAGPVRADAGGKPRKAVRNGE
jgi:hypothetical protein